MSLSGLSDELAQVRTRKKEFLTQMDRIIPWSKWVKIIIRDSAEINPTVWS